MPPHHVQRNSPRALTNQKSNGAPQMSLPKLPCDKPIRATQGAQGGLAVETSETGGKRCGLGWGYGVTVQELTDKPRHLVSAIGRLALDLR